MVKKIKFIVDENGQVSVSVEGAVGAECDQMTAPFEEALGTISKKTRKDAFYQATETAQTDQTLESL